MNRCPRPLLVALAIMLSATAMADPANYSGHRLVRVDLFSPADLETLLRISPDIWSDAIGLGRLDARIPPERMAALAASGLPYEVLIDDIGPLATAHLDSSLGRGTWDNYMNFAQMTAYINDLAASKPGLCEVFSIGTSIEGRDIWVLHLAGADPDPKPAVFYHSTIHAREWITAPIVLYLATYLVNNYGSDLGVTALVNSLDIYIAPCVNPDGYSYTWTNDRMWRKNRRSNGDGSYGVDLNRNWDYAWGLDDSGSSPYPSSDTYRGSAPFSEPETQALRDFFITHPDIVAYMDYHSYGQHVMWPWGFQCTTPEEPDGTIFSTLGTTMASMITAVHGKSYDAFPICIGLYSVNGGSVDWAYGDQGVYALTVELRDTGSYGFVLPPEQILPTCQENFPALLHLTDWAADFVSTTISLPSGVPDALPPGVPTTIDVQIETSYETIVADSAQLHYRYDGGTYQTLPLTHIDGSLYQATLPPPSCDDIAEYYISARGTSSGYHYAPIGAPVNRFTAPVGELVTVYTTDFEGGLGWTVTSDAADGQWERGIPVDCQRGDPPADYDGSGRCYLTDNNATDCNSDVDDGYTYLLSPNFNLSEHDAQVRYALWYTNFAGSSAYEDVFKTYVSNNGGSTWTLVETVGPTTSAGWTEHAFTVGDYVTPTAQVRVRFEASDLGAGSVVEAGIDAFRVESVVCDAPPICPGDMNCDGLVDYADIDPFVAALSCVGGAPTCWPPAGVSADCPWINADCNGDGEVSYGDIDPFVARIGTTCQ